MKRRELEQRLIRLGWWQIQGSKHAKWTNGLKITMIPRHTEINEWTARAILKFVVSNPGTGVRK